MPAITDLPIWTTEGYEIRTQGVTDTTPATYTYAGTMGNYVFRNDGGVNLTLTINGSAVTVATGQMVTGNTFSSFTVQASSGSVSWTMRAFQESPMNISQSASSNMSSLLTFQSGATAIGNGTAVDVSGYATLSLRVVISATATITFEASVDGTNFTAMTGTRTDGTVGAVTTLTNDFRFVVSGLKFFRARISAYTSGTVDVTGYASTVAGNVATVVNTAYGSSDTNGASNVIQGVGAYNLLFDGTNWVRWRSGLGIGDGQTGAGTAAVALAAFNGTSWDKLRTVALDGITTTGLLANGSYAYNGTTWDRIRAVNGGQLLTTIRNSSGNELSIVSNLSNIADNNSMTYTGIQSASIGYGYSGASYDRVRVGKVYKYIEYLNLANATATTVWTPATGKKFRLMGVSVSVSAAATVSLLDGVSGSAFMTFRTGGADSKDFYFGNGVLSGVADRVMQVYNASGATINVWVHAWGTEE